MDIQLHTTDELLDELTRRYRNMAFAGRGFEEESGLVEGDQFKWRWKGDHHLCIGMLNSVQQRIETAFVEDQA